MTWLLFTTADACILVCDLQAHITDIYILNAKKYT